MFDFQEFISEAMRFTRKYSGILKVKIINFLGEEAEKSIHKTKGSICPCKKVMKGTFKSRTSAKSISKAKEKLTQLQWVDDYIRPRKSKSNFSGSNNSDYEEEIKSFSNDSAEEDDVSKEKREKHVDIKEQKDDKCEKKQVKCVKNPKDIARNGKRGKRKATKEVTEIKKEELDVLRSVAANTIQLTNRDNFDLFSKYVATKTGKLSQKLKEEEIEAVGYDITAALVKARNKTGPVQTWPNYYQLKHVPAKRSTTPYMIMVTLIFVDFIHNLFLYNKYIKNKIHISMFCFR